MREILYLAYLLSVAAPAGKSETNTHFQVRAEPMLSSGRR